MRIGVLAAVTSLVALAGCNERLDSSAGCPIACTDQSAQIQTVTLDAVSSDTTVIGGLGKGTEHIMLLASRGDTLDTRVIIRFDTLPSTSVAKSGGNAVPINTADSVTLALTLDSAAINIPAPITINVYDVDDSTMVDDTSAAALAPLFVPSRLITSQTFLARSLFDSVKVTLPSAFVLAKAQAGARLRLGLQLTSSVSAQAHIYSSESTEGPTLSMRTSPDTSVAKVVLSPYSKTPTNNTSIAASLGDFTLIVKGTPPPPAGMLAVGGLPGTRVYFRFSLPSRIVDSSLVVRATILLNQVPSGSPDPTDTMHIQPYLVLAGPTVADPTKAAQILAATTIVTDQTFDTFPSTSGQGLIEVAPVFTYWAAQPESQLPRAIVLESTQEDYSGQQALFYSSTASDPTLRPKLRISYTLRSRIGIP